MYTLLRYIWLIGLSLALGLLVTPVVYHPQFELTTYASWDIFFNNPAFAHWTKYYLKLQYWQQLVISYIGGLTSAIILISLNGLSIKPRLGFFSRLKLSLSYPPTRLVVATVACFWLYQIRTTLDTKDALPLYSIVTTFLIGYLSPAIANSLKAAKRKTTEKKPELNNNILGPEFNWLYEEGLKSKLEDKFNREPYINRLKSRLQSNSGHSRRGIALVGGHGMGKSFILDEVQTELAQKNWIFVRIDSWGRGEDKDLQAQILEMVIQEINRYVDTMAFKSLPQQYLNALNIYNSKLGVTLGLFSQNKSVEDVLANIDKILNAINYQLVIVIEDIDRADNPKAAANSAAELFDKLPKEKNDSRICYIFAIGHHDYTSDIINRVAYFREDLTQVELLPEMVKFIAQCLIYSNGAGSREKNFVEPLYLHHDFFDLKENTYSRALDYSSLLSNSLCKELGNLSQIISTVSPRMVKQVFREVASTWKELSGEIDLIDLLIITFLKTNFPSTFDYIFANWPNLLTYSSDMLKQIDAPLEESTQEKNIQQDDLKKPLIPNKDDYLALPNAGKELLHALLLRQKEYSEDKRELTQHCVDKKPPMYWDRLNRKAVIIGEITDSKLLSNTFSYSGTQELFDFDNQRNILTETGRLGQFFDYIFPKGNKDSFLIRTCSELETRITKNTDVNNEKNLAFNLLALCSERANNIDELQGNFIPLLNSITQKDITLVLIKLSSLNYFSLEGIKISDNAFLLYSKFIKHSLEHLNWPLIFPTLESLELSISEKEKKSFFRFFHDDNNWEILNSFYEHIHSIKHQDERLFLSFILEIFHRPGGSKISSNEIRFEANIDLLYETNKEKLVGDIDELLSSDFISALEHDFLEKLKQLLSHQESH